MAALSSDPLAWGEARFRGGYTLLPSMGKDARQCTRRSIRCGIRLRCLQPDFLAGEVLAAECVNISDSGLYAILSPGHLAANGNRYEFRLLIGERGPEGAEQVVMQEGVVVRTELVLGPGENRIGIGVRLCGHRTGVIPMPSRV